MFLSNIAKDFGHPARICIMLDLDAVIFTNYIMHYSRLKL